MKPGSGCELFLRSMPQNPETRDQMGGVLARYKRELPGRGVGFSMVQYEIAFSTVRFIWSLAGKAPKPPTLKLYLILPHSEGHRVTTKPMLPGSVVRLERETWIWRHGEKKDGVFGMRPEIKSRLQTG